MGAQYTDVNCTGIALVINIRAISTPLKGVNDVTAGNILGRKRNFVPSTRVVPKVRRHQLFSSYFEYLQVMLYIN